MKQATSAMRSFLLIFGAGLAIATVLDVDGCGKKEEPKAASIIAPARGQ